MKKFLMVCAVVLAVVFLVVNGAKQKLEETMEAAVVSYVEEVAPTRAPTAPSTQPPVETTQPALPEPVYAFSSEEQVLLLQIGMAERGGTGCRECVALVMRTVLNRMEAEKFPSTIRNVIYAEGQFTPVADGTFWSVEPNEICYEALDMVTRGWDESQGALYYEWCQGESWHSKNLTLLTQHCDMRLYQ